MKYPATLIAHWPAQDFPCCRTHAMALRQIADAMGMPLSITEIEGDVLAECINCLDEAKKAE